MFPELCKICFWKYCIIHISLMRTKCPFYILICIKIIEIPHLKSLGTTIQPPSFVSDRESLKKISMTDPLQEILSLLFLFVCFAAMMPLLKLHFLQVVRIFPLILWPYRRIPGLGLIRIFYLFFCSLLWSLKLWLKLTCQIRGRLGVKKEVDKII